MWEEDLGAGGGDRPYLEPTRKLKLGALFTSGARKESARKTQDPEEPREILLSGSCLAY